MALEIKGLVWIDGRIYRKGRYNAKADGPEIFIRNPPALFSLRSLRPLWSTALY
jgi:hypothetical protein